MANSKPTKQTVSEYTCPSKRSVGRPGPTKTALLQQPALRTWTSQESALIHALASLLAADLRRRPPKV